MSPGDLFYLPDPVLMLFFFKFPFPPPLLDNSRVLDGPRFTALARVSLNLFFGFVLSLFSPRVSTIPLPSPPPLFSKVTLGRGRFFRVPGAEFFNPPHLDECAPEVLVFYAVFFFPSFPFLHVLLGFFVGGERCFDRRIPKVPGPTSPSLASSVFFSFLPVLFAGPRGQRGGFVCSPFCCHCPHHHRHPVPLSKLAVVWVFRKRGTSEFRPPLYCGPALPFGPTSIFKNFFLFLSSQSPFPFLTVPFLMT